MVNLSVDTVAVGRPACFNHRTAIGGYDGCTAASSNIKAHMDTVPDALPKVGGDNTTHGPHHVAGCPGYGLIANHRRFAGGRLVIVSRGSGGLIAGVVGRGCARFGVIII